MGSFKSIDNIKQMKISNFVVSLSRPRQWHKKIKITLNLRVIDHNKGKTLFIIIWSTPNPNMYGDDRSHNRSASSNISKSAERVF